MANLAALLFFGFVVCLWAGLWWNSRPLKTSAYLMGGGLVLGAMCGLWPG